MEKESISNGVQGEQQKVIAAQNLANQFNKGDTELSLDENVRRFSKKSTIPGNKSTAYIRTQ
jgi:hypothetical protein